MIGGRLERQRGEELDVAGLTHKLLLREIIDTHAGLNLNGTGEVVPHRVEGAELLMNPLFLKAVPASNVTKLCSTAS
jgi:hypothetical protein